ncbi:MAG: hypothetical protein ABUT20_18575 [Bacteroidota bacterium]
MKKIVLQLLLSAIFLTALSQVGFSQTILSSDKKKLREKEDSLKVFAQTMVLDSTTAGRMIADSQFIRTLVRTLQIKNSFYYPFDSVQGISKLYAPDTSFRIFTWTIEYDDNYSRQRGAIQLRTADGSLKLIALRDYSEFTDNALDSVRNKNNWIGAVYYKIIKTQFKGKNYYTLFGYDNNSAMSSMRWIEVLTFNEKKEPVFGGPFFSFEKDSIPKPPQNRYSLEYKKDAGILADYIPDLGMILVDHLISETDEPDNKWTYVPDGDNEGFKWENGKWMHIDKVFTLKLQDGQAPIGDPLLDPKGNKDEKKLQDKTNKNKGQKKDENDY